MEVNTPQEQDAVNEAEWRNSRNWKLGIFYYSERDSRPWVPKRSLFGKRHAAGTPNLAKKEARWYLMVIIGTMLLLLLIVGALERAGVLP